MPKRIVILLHAQTAVAHAGEYSVFLISTPVKKAVHCSRMSIKIKHKLKKIV